MRHRAAVLGAILPVAIGCRSVSGPRVGVASVSFEGNRNLRSGDLRERIATQAAPKFLGLWRARWLNRQPFEPAVLQKDLERIEHYYRRRGFYDASVRAGRVFPNGEHWVDVEILLDEGAPVHVGSVDVAFDSAHPVPESVAMRVRHAVTLDPGDVFDSEAFEHSAAAIERVLAEDGYAYGKVKPHATVDLGTRAARLSYEVDAQIACHVGAVTFEGLGDLPEAQIRRVFRVHAGVPYAADDLEAGRRALLDLGVFASVDVVPDLSNASHPEIPLLVRVTRSALHALRLGIGSQIDFTRADAHARVVWEHRNLFGGLRHLTVEERPAIVFFPTALPNLSFPQKFLPANSIAITFQQPSFPEARTTSSVRAEFNRYPVILPPLDRNQPVMPGYNEVRGVVGPERNFALIRLRSAITYNLQANFPFTYFGERNPAFGRVVASYVDLHTELDLRDDPFDAHEGLFLSTSLQFAGGVLGGDASDVRVRPEARFYVPLGRDLTLAARGVLGLLFPRNYGEMLGADFLGLPDTNPPGTRAGVPGYIRDLQITYFRGFFSGGADSNRGYGFREIGPHGVNPAIIPGTVAEEKARCTPGSADYSGTLCFVPSGGLTLWEASLELRTAVYGHLGAVAFLDASDVAPNSAELRLNVPHLSVGLGIRYATPVGPLRFDVGFRVPGAQRIGGPLRPATDGPEPGRLFGLLPAAIAIGLGEAY